MCGKDMRRRQRGMAAEIDFRRWGEPAQTPAIPIAAGKCRFRQIVLAGDCLHQMVGQPRVENENGGRIATKQAVGEGIYLIHAQRLRHCRYYIFRIYIFLSATSSIR